MAVIFGSQPKDKGSNPLSGADGGYSNGYRDWPFKPEKWVQPPYRRQSVSSNNNNIWMSETGTFDMLVTVTFEGEIGTASAQRVDVNSPELGWIVTISNNAGVELPMTGGPGTLLYTLSGLALMLGAALMYGFRMRRRERRLN